MRSLLSTITLLCIAAHTQAQHPDPNKKLALYSSVTTLGYDSAMNVYHLTTTGGLHMKLHRSLVRIVSASSRDKKAVWRYAGEPYFYIETARFYGQPWARPSVENGKVLSNKNW